MNEDRVPCSEWVDRFIVHVFVLGLLAEPDTVGAIALELYPTLGHLSPEDAAQTDWEVWLTLDD